MTCDGNQCTSHLNLCIFVTLLPVTAVTHANHMTQVDDPPVQAATAQAPAALGLSSLPYEDLKAKFTALTGKKVSRWWGKRRLIKEITRALATDALRAAVVKRNLVTLWSAMNTAVECGVNEETTLEEAGALVPVLATEALRGATKARDLTMLWWVMNTAGMVEGVDEALIKEARATMADLLAQNRLDCLLLIVADNSQIDAITGKMVRMDTEMVKVSVDAGEGATGLVTWELAHTTAEAAQLAKAMMNRKDGRIPMFHDP